MRILRTFLAAALFLSMGYLSAHADDGPIRVRGCRPMLREGAAGGGSLKVRRTTPDDHYIGDRRQLTVLVNFNDQAFTAEEPLAQWEKIFNTEGLVEEPFFGSVRDYFTDQSYGQFRPSFDLYHVSLDQPRSKYRSTSSDDENSQYLVNDIMEVLKEEEVEWPVYDWDGDGYVDQLLILYAGKGQNAGGDRNTIWAHQWWMTEHKDKETGEKLPPVPVVYNGTVYLVDCYCAVPELDQKGGYGSFGTICHEYSHCFGFPDFYYGSYSIVGDWDLMDYGNYNQGGFCPAGYSAHERMLMGWLMPTELTDPASISGLLPLSDEGQAYLIRNNGYADEYYIVENRQQKGWDRYLPGSGVVVFHIDYDPALWGSITDFVNTYDTQRYTIFPANGRNSTYMSEGWAYPYQDNDSLTDTSTPAAKLLHANAEGNYLMSKPLYHIKVENGEASFDFLQTGESSVGNILLRESRPVETLYRMGRVHIVRCENGEVRKIVVKE